MDDLFLALLLVSIAALVIGIINPRLILRWDREKLTRFGYRKAAVLIFSFLSILFFILFGITAEPSQPRDDVRRQQLPVEQPKEPVASEQKQQDIEEPIVRPEETKTTPPPQTVPIPLPKPKSTTTQIPATSPSPPAWQKVASFSGIGDKNTAPFVIGKQWRINYSFQAQPDAREYGARGLFVVWLYDVNSGKKVETLINAQGSGDASSGSDTVYAYRAGNLYIKTIAPNTSWKMDIEELK